MAELVEYIELKEVFSRQKFDINLSAVTGDKQWLFIASDEGTGIQLFHKERHGVYQGRQNLFFLSHDESDAAELDIEALARWGDTVYGIGSHSHKRQKIKPRKTVADNIERLQQIVKSPLRDILFRFEVDEQGNPLPASLKTLSLRSVLVDHPVLAPFQSIPGKENGIDIEGLSAIGKDQLLLGFRGPVLRQNYLPILEISVDFTTGRIIPQTYYINLGGRGVRSMESLGDGDGGHLLLAGPNGDQSISYQLFYWNGQSVIPGKDRPQAAANIKLLCTLPSLAEAEDAPPEGLLLIAEEERSYSFMVLHDGVKGGAPRIFRCPRPR